MTEPSEPKPRVNFSTPLYRGRVFELVKENLTFPGGVTADVDIIRHPGASAIVPMTAPETVVLIRQYRHALGDFIWEIPAGTLAPDEPPLDCARRELTEETGYQAARWEKLGEITPVPGYSDERIHLFLASDLSPSGQQLDPDELLVVREVPFGKALAMAEQGVIQDAKSITALFLARQRLGGRGSEQ